MAFSIGETIRIERTVWALDTFVQDLPGRSRRAIRREMRSNLREASTEVGARTAIDRLGNLHRVAAEYLDAEYGDDQPRPQVLRGAWWTVVTVSIMVGCAIVGYVAFVAGIEAAVARPTGAFVWDDLRLLGVVGEITYAEQGVDSFALTLSMWALLYPLAAMIIGGRLWRLAAASWRSRARRPSQRS